MSSLDRRRHVVRQPRRADDPVLHLLLDVRLPADRRPRLGRRRQPHARLPARRHRGPHDAQRRGPAARGRPLAPAQRDDPELRRLRPDLRLRARGDHPRRPAAHVHRAGGRLLLPHADERELRSTRRCRRAPRRASCAGMYLLRRRRGRGRRSSCWARARSCARCWPARSCCATTSASRRTSGASRASPSCGREGMEAERWNTLHPGEEPRTTCVAAAARRRGRPGVAATDYMRAFADQIRPWVDAPVPRARHRRLRPQRLPQDAALVLRGGPPPRRRSRR